MTDQELRQVRAAQNQSLFRAVNAKLVELNEAFEPLGDRSIFMCECAALDCIQQIDMTLHDYERVRSNPKRFIVAPSQEHVLSDVEDVVEEHGSYYVVEKIGAAAEFAQQSGRDLT